MQYTEPPRCWGPWCGSRWVYLRNHVGQEGQENSQVLPDSGGAPGQIDYQCTAPNSRYTTGEQGCRLTMHPVCQDGLREAWQRSLHDGLRGFRGHVSRRQACTSGGQDEVARGLSTVRIAVYCVTPLFQRPLDQGLVVWKNSLPCDL
eukprot:scaffold1811_cov411-Prasinococcus_capsulatus_cf.AAC.13